MDATVSSGVRQFGDGGERMSNGWRLAAGGKKVHEELECCDALKDQSSARAIVQRLVSTPSLQPSVSSSSEPT
jgi:hypothetical protein